MFKISKKYKTIEGIASSERLDSAGDIVKQRFDFSEIRKTKKFLFAHLKNENIGTIQKIWIKDNKLWFKAKFCMENDFASALFFCVSEGLLSDVSILITHMKRDGNIIKSSKLLEISLIPEGGNKDARVTPETLRANEDDFKKYIEFTDKNSGLAKKDDEDIKQLFIDVIQRMKKDGNFRKNIYAEVGKGSFKAAISRMAYHMKNGG